MSAVKVIRDESDGLFKVVVEMNPLEVKPGATDVEVLRAASFVIARMVSRRLKAKGGDDG